MGRGAMGAKSAFEGFDFEGFWDDCEYSLENYVEPAPSDELIASIEEELGGFRLPAAYVELARTHNGGRLRRNCYPMDEPTGWAADHIAVTGLYAIGRASNHSLCGGTGSKFWEQEWEYPPIGVYIADTPTAGHEMIALDYRECGKQGEPRVVYVDQEDDYSITFVAPDFAAFVRGLADEEEYDTSEEVREEAIAVVESGTLSPIVLRALDAAGARLPDGERMLRTVARQIVDEKGHFSLHDDERSHLMYGLMFWLYSLLRTAGSFEDFVERPKEQTSYDRPCYELMITTRFVTNPYGFCTGGHAPDFVRNWWNARIAVGEIVTVSEGFRFTPEAETALLHRLAIVAGTPEASRSS
jgi:hypothetical protein